MTVDTILMLNFSLHILELVAIIGIIYFLWRHEKASSKDVTDIKKDIAKLLAMFVDKKRN